MRAEIFTYKNRKDNYCYRIRYSVMGEQGNDRRSDMRRFVRKDDEPRLA